MEKMQRTEKMYNKNNATSEKMRKTKKLDHNSMDK